ncbi:MAG: DivIVA domain-containing protein [Clostridia bacterium]|nr:DivIVA domain-containing protein [Clostridia bacterium]
MQLTSEYLRNIRFTVRRGNTYDAREVDRFMDELIEAVEEMELQPTDTQRVERLEAVCSIRAEMTDKILREILSAEKQLQRMLTDENPEDRN